jgi:hypothetical protein
MKFSQQDLRAFLRQVADENRTQSICKLAAFERL